MLACLDVPQPTPAWKCGIEISLLPLCPLFFPPDPWGEVRASKLSIDGEETT